MDETNLRIGWPLHPAFGCQRCRTLALWGQVKIAAWSNGKWRRTLESEAESVSTLMFVFGRCRKIAETRMGRSYMRLPDRRAFCMPFCMSQRYYNIDAKKTVDDDCCLYYLH